MLKKSSSIENDQRRKSKTTPPQKTEIPGKKDKIKIETTQYLIKYALQITAHA